MKQRIDIIEQTQAQHGNEIALLRQFKHDTNGHLNVHNGKLNFIESQQNNTAEAVERLTVIVEDAINKLSNLITTKAMLKGAGMVLIPTITGCFILFEWLKSKGLL